MSSNQKYMLIDHKVITVTPAENELEFLDILNDGYDILDSTALPDGSITYVLRKRLRDGAYNNGVQIDPFKEVNDLGIPLDVMALFPPDIEE